jgi:hypothetical protein
MVKKLDPLDHTTAINVQARNDSFGEHAGDCKGSSPVLKAIAFAANRR